MYSIVQSWKLVLWCKFVLLPLLIIDILQDLLNCFLMFVKISPTDVFKHFGGIIKNLKVVHNLQSTITFKQL